MEEKQWYVNNDYDSIKVFIESNLSQMSRNFIAIGYYLKQVRDRKLFAIDGYMDIWQFAKDQYGISRSTASRWMSMNDKFSFDGNSPIMGEGYIEFNKSQLQEMLYLPEEKLEEAQPGMTVKEIRELKPQAPDEIPEEMVEDVPGQMELIKDFPEVAEEKTQELLSAAGLPKRVYPADSLIGDEGCGKLNCFQCHRDGCKIRGEICYCVEAPMGNPFPCTKLEETEKLNKEIGNRCQFVNEDLAYHRGGDGQPEPCCKNCNDLCSYACSRAVKQAEEKKRKETGNGTSIDRLDLSMATYNILVRAGYSTVEQLAKLTRSDLKAIQNFDQRCQNDFERAWEEYRKSKKGEERKKELVERGIPETEPEPENQSEEICATSHREIMHFTKENKGTIDGGYGCCWAEVVEEYYKAREDGQENSELKLKSLAKEYTALRRETVTVFYDGEGDTLFDVENKRIDEEFAHYQKRKQEQETPETEERTPEWFVKAYFDGRKEKGEIIKICQENKLNSVRGKKIQEYLSPYGARGGNMTVYGKYNLYYDFYSHAKGVKFGSDGRNQKVTMSYTQLAAYLEELYGPFEMQKPDQEAAEEKQKETGPDALTGKSGTCKLECNSSSGRKEEPECTITTWPDLLADIPEFARLSVMDYMDDVEKELKEFLAVDGLPGQMVTRKQMEVAGLRLLLELVKGLEEQDDEES